MNLSEMSDDACIRFLESHTFGHLGCSGEGYPYVIPINYACEARKVFMFSMPGQKVEYLRARPYACLQVEDVGAAGRWESVIVQGLFEELPDTDDRRTERLYAWSLLEKRPLWWEPGSFEITDGISQSEGGPVFFSLSIQIMSGRRVEHRS